MKTASNPYIKVTKTPVKVNEKATPDQVMNNTGGYVHQISKLDHLKRFLLLGTEGGTYYQTEADITKQNITCLTELVKTNPLEVLQVIQDYLVRGAAPKRNTLMFALAYTIKKCGNADLANMGYSIASEHINIPTDFFDFIACIKAFGGFSTGVKKCITRWYQKKDDKTLDYHFAKYGQRNGWTHKDLLNLAHIPFTSQSGNRQALIQYIVYKEGELNPKKALTKLPEYLSENEPQEWNRNTWASNKAKKADLKETISLIENYNLPMECVSKEHLASGKVWEALLKQMPYNATIRNLNNFDKHELLKIGSSTAKIVIDRINNDDQIKKSKIHPIAILLASTMYNSPYAAKNSRVIEALDSAFKKAFANVDPSGKNMVIALDTSGSMNATLNKYPISAVQFGAKLAEVLYDTEPNSYVGYFSNKFEFVSKPSEIMKNRVVAGTDPSSVIARLMNDNITVDCIVTITDNECNSGYNFTDILKKYREKVKKNVKLVVIGLTSTNFSIGDPNDVNVLGIAGFDPAVPQVISEFMKL